MRALRLRTSDFGLTIVAGSGPLGNPDRSLRRVRYIQTTPVGVVIIHGVVRRTEAQ